jgi:hypothetical protein
LSTKKNPIRIRRSRGQIGNNRRPALGCVVSRLRGTGGPIPPYVSVSDHRLLRSYDDPEEPAYLGPAHRPFNAVGQVMQDLSLHPDVSRDCLEERRALLREFDGLQGGLGDRLEAADAYTARALEMITSTRVRDALDLGRESVRVRERYGAAAGLDFLRARRLVEAGVSVVSVASRFPVRIGGGIIDPGGWDTHGHNFTILRAKLPMYDQAVYALLTDLDERGLLDDVAVVIWGEFGRTPRIGDSTPDGRGHWHDSGFAFLAGGGLQTGQVIGESDARGERPRFRRYTPQHVLASLYHVLGIDPAATTLQDHSGRPRYLLDRPERIAALG